jgi:hypothetical protein
MSSVALRLFPIPDRHDAASAGAERVVAAPVRMRNADQVVGADHRGDAAASANSASQLLVLLAKCRNAALIVVPSSDQLSGTADKFARSGSPSAAIAMLRFTAFPRRQTDPMPFVGDVARFL